jgi:RNA polymerase sigma-70 factor (ECF subfamily)
MKITKDKIFDELLVMQHLVGHKTAFEILVKRWNKKLWFHSFRFTKNSEVSKDIVQECWIIIFENLNKLKNKNSFGVWALSMVSKKSIDWVRTQMKENKMHEDVTAINKLNSENDPNTNETELKLKFEIKKLPDKQRIVLNMFYLESYSIKEISSILSIKTGTVKSRLFKAREQLKKCIIKNNSHEKK